MWQVSHSFLFADGFPTPSWFALTPRMIVIGAAVAIVTPILLVVGKIPLSYNLRNLIVRWPVTLLTAMAFTLVILLQTVMLGLVAGMDRLTDNSGQPGNVIVLSDGALDEQMSNLGLSDTADVDRQPLVQRNDKNIPLSSHEIYAVVTQPIPVPEGAPERRRFVQVRGLDDPQMSALVHGVELYPGGSWFSTAGVQELPGAADGAASAVQAVLGEGVAGQLGKDFGREELRIGDVFELGPRKWIVTGIMKSSGSTYGSEIWAKASLIGPMFGKETYSSIVLRTASAADAAKLSDQLSTEFKKAAVVAQPETKYFSNLAETNRQFARAILFLSIVMGIGGTFGVMNTMFAAVSGRTKDIGVLRILGYARWQILVSFFVESLCIAVAGGLVGIAIGSLANGVTTNSIVASSSGAGGKFVVLQLVIGADTLLLGMLLALAIGAIGGLLPAISAMRLKPLESLR